MCCKLEGKTTVKREKYMKDFLKTFCKLFYFIFEHFLILDLDKVFLSVDVFTFLKTLIF